jgi:hypothetical protein
MTARPLLKSPPQQNFSAKATGLNIRAASVQWASKLSRAAHQAETPSKYISQAIAERCATFGFRSPNRFIRDHPKIQAFDLLERGTADAWS